MRECRGGTAGKIKKGRMIIRDESIQTACATSCKKARREESSDPGRQDKRTGGEAGGGRGRKVLIREEKNLNEIEKKGKKKTYLQGEGREKGSGMKNSNGE